jgi:chaperonin cofactor prefoldin
MNEDLSLSDRILADKYPLFSNTIKKVVELKKSKKAEMKSFCEKIQNDLKKLDEDANIARSFFCEWPPEKI